MAQGVSADLAQRIKDIIVTISFEYNGTATNPNAALFTPGVITDGELPLFVVKKQGRDVIDINQRSQYVITSNWLLQALIYRIGGKVTSQIEQNVYNLLDATELRFLETPQLELSGDTFHNAAYGAGVDLAGITGVLMSDTPYPQGGDAGQTYYQVLFNLSVKYTMRCSSG